MNIVFAIAIAMVLGYAPLAFAQDADPATTEDAAATEDSAEAEETAEGDEADAGDDADSSEEAAAADDSADAEEPDAEEAEDEDAEEEEEAPFATLGCEIGFNLSEGNSSTRTLASACNSKKQAGIVGLSLAGGWNYGLARFGRGTNRGAFTTNQNNWFAQLREDFFLNDAETAYVFSVQGFNGDPLAGLNWMFLGQVGAGYAYVKGEGKEHKVEGGYQITIENYADGTDDTRQAVFIALLGNALLNDSAAYEYSVIFTPSIDDFNAADAVGVGTSSDYRLNGMLGMKFTLTDRMSFATRVETQYDNHPNAVEAVDSTGTGTGIQQLAKPWDTTWNNLLIVTLY